MESRESEANSSSAVSVFIFFFTVLVFIFFVARKKKETEPSLPPGPRGLPLLGSLPFLDRNLHVWFKTLADLHGPIFKLYLGSKLFVVLSSPEVVQETLKNNDVVFSNHDASPAALVSFYGGKYIVWAPYGEFWRMVRKVTVQDLLSAASIEGLSDLRETQVRRMENFLSQCAGDAVNVRELASSTAMNMMTEMLWGGTVAKHVEIEFTKAVAELLDVVGAPNFSEFFPLLSWLDLQGLVKQARKVSAWINRILDGIVEERRRVVNPRKDFLQVLLDISQNTDPEEPMTDDVVKALLLDMVAGGTETTATTVEWAMAELLCDPEMMKRAKDEIADLVGEGGIVEEAHLPRLRYLAAVVKETLRMHPPLPLLVARFPSSTCTIAGYRIPRGTRVWAIQSDPALWEEASQFKPERFLNEKVVAEYGRSSWYLPFGAGRRICVGIMLGEKMVTFILASLLQSADWALPRGETAEILLKEKFGPVMRKEKALVAITTPR